MKCFRRSFIFCLSHYPVTTHNSPPSTFCWLFAVLHHEPPPRGPKCSRFIKCHEGNTHTPCAPWIFVNRTVNCVYKNVCPVCMLLLVQLKYAKDAHSVPIPPPTEQKHTNTKSQRAGNTAPAVLVLSFDTSHCQRGKRQMFLADIWV